MNNTWSITTEMEKNIVTKNEDPFIVGEMCVLFLFLLLLLAVKETVYLCSCCNCANNK
jgi:hypothetical protein